MLAFTNGKLIKWWPIVGLQFSLFCLLQDKQCKYSYPFKLVFYPFQTGRSSLSESSNATVEKHSIRSKSELKETSISSKIYSSKSVVWHEKFQISSCVNFLIKREANGIRFKVKTDRRRTLESCPFSGRWRLRYDLVFNPEGNRKCLVVFAQCIWVFGSWSSS